MVLHVWRVPAPAVPLALVRMAVDRLRLAGTPGLRFRKLLGTGHGRSFASTDADPRTWALLTVWDDERTSLAFEAHPTPRGWRRIAAEEWRGDMTPLRTHGRWSGAEPFVVDRGLATTWTGPVAAITRARIRPSRWRTFWSAVPPVVADLDAHDGPSVRLGIGEAPVGVQGTFTVWPSTAAMTDFAYRRGAHRAAIDDTERLGWYAEELFARLALTDERGTLFGVDRTARQSAEASPTNGPVMPPPPSPTSASPTSASPTSASPTSASPTRTGTDHA